MNTTARPIKNTVATVGKYAILQTNVCGISVYHHFNGDRFTSNMLVHKTPDRLVIVFEDEGGPEVLLDYTKKRL